MRQLLWSVVAAQRPSEQARAFVGGLRGRGRGCAPVAEICNDRLLRRGPAETNDELRARLRSREADTASVCAERLSTEEESEPGPFANFTGREERIENPLAMLFGDPRAVVLDQELDIAIRLNGSCEHDFRSSGFGGVLDEVEEDVIGCGGRSVNLDLVATLDLYFRASTDRVRQKRHRRFDTFFQVERLGRVVLVGTGMAAQSGG